MESLVTSHETWHAICYFEISFSYLINLPKQLRSFCLAAISCQRKALGTNTAWMERMLDESNFASTFHFQLLRKAENN